MTQERQARLIAELECLRALKKTSSIFDFEGTGTAPERYTLSFRGKGIARDTSADADVEYVELHRIEMRLPYSFPQRPPDIRWVTPIFHPNVSFSGFINFNDIGLPWEKDLGLDVVCERLWDVARFAFVNLDKAVNYAAKNWIEDDCQLPLPADPRPLRDKTAPTGSNVIRYERRGDRRLAMPEATANSDILFIGEDTPIPDLPRRPPIRRAAGTDDEIFYIGDD